MVKQFLKKRSKRMSCRKKYKIERKVRQHNKKVKKEARKNPKSQKRKDPGVPNSLPFKEKILDEAAERKRRLEEERQKQKQKAKMERQKLLDKKRNLGSLVSDALKRGDDFNRKQQSGAAADKLYDGGRAVETSLKAYYKEFRKVVDAADVVLQVLDARDPLGCRCPQVEEAILSAGPSKRLILVLNKIDLVPKENVEAWLKYLRNEFPTVAFKASTQSQTENLSHLRMPMANLTDDMKKSSRCLGADVLMKLLGNYCRNKDVKTSIRVGVVGFPNTGKSSIINSLKRSKACNVGSTPGVTKAMQEVQLDKHIKLLDSPGIVMATGTSESAVILRNCVKIETVEDPVIPVSAILKRCQKDQIMMHYGLGEFQDVNEFLALLAKKQGRLRKGGVPDVVKAGKSVLQDWNQGRITFYTHPPEQQQVHVAAEIVSEMSKEFDIAALLEEEKRTLKGLKQRSTSDIVIESSGPTEMQTEEALDAEAEDMDSEEDDEDDDEEEEEDEEEDMEEDKEELKQVTVTMGTRRQKGKGKQPAKMSTVQPKKKAETKSAPGKSAPVKSAPAGMLQLNKAKKQQFKKMKKERRRADAVSGKLSSALEDAFSGLGSSG